MKKVKLQTLIMFIGLLSLLVISSFLVASGGSAKTSDPPQTLKIGELVCLTGWFSNLDVIQNKAAQVEADIINEQGGVTIKGQRYNIQLVTQDGKSSMDGITAATTKLIIDDGVKFIVGPGAAFSSAAVPPAEANKVLHVSIMNVATPGEMNKDTPYAFLGTNGSHSQNLCRLQAIKKAYPNVKKVALLCPDDGSVPYLGPFMQKALTDHGLQQAGQLIAFANDTQDFSSIAIRLNGISDADAYHFINSAPPHVANIVKQLRQLGNFKPLCCNSGTSDVLPIINSNTLATELITKDLVINAAGNTPQMDNLLNKLVAKGISTEYPEHASSLYTLVYVIGQAQSLDPTVVKNKWESLDSVPTLFGTGKMGGEKTFGIKNHAVSTPLPYSVVKNGKATTLGWMTPSDLP